MKKIMLAVVSCAVILSLAACDNKHAYSDKTEQDVVESNDCVSMESEDMELLTKEELIELCDLSEEEYADKDLDQFIEFFLLNKENVKKYNVHALLADYIVCRNVEYLFSDTESNRKSDFTKDVVYIAFRENINTATNSAFIDVGEKQKWACECQNIFWNLDNYKSTAISESDIEDVLERFETLGVFSLKSFHDKLGGFSDPVSFSLVIEYKDGTHFKVTRSGLPSKIQPENYKEWRALLF